MLSASTILSFNYLAVKSLLAVSPPHHRFIIMAYYLQLYMGIVFGHEWSKCSKMSCRNLATRYCCIHTNCLFNSVYALWKLDMSDMSTRTAFTVFRWVNYSCCGSFTCFHPSFFYLTASQETLKHQHPTIPINKTPLQFENRAVKEYLLIVERLRKL